MAKRRKAKRKTRKRSGLKRWLGFFFSAAVLGIGIFGYLHPKSLLNGLLRVGDYISILYTPSGPILPEDEVIGIDVSKYQLNIDWEKVKDANARFAFVKASEGASLADRKFKRNWEAAHRSGIPVGAYHFFRPQRSAELQAGFFVEQVGALRPGDLPPVLDVEERDGVASEEVARKALIWLRSVEEALGVAPILYSGRNFYHEHLHGRLPERYRVWVAHYRRPRTSIKHAKGWLFWQYTDQGELAGISTPVDLNRFGGSLEELHALCVPGKYGGL
jgi:lysozyme